MKRLLVVLLMVLGLIIPAHSYAQTAPSASVSPSQVMSPEDMAKIRNQLAELSKAMGNPPVASAAPSAKPEESKTEQTVEKVADKALDMMGNAVATLSNSLSKIAPHVWRIMIVQQYAKAVDNIITPFLMLVLVGVFSIVSRKNFPPPPPWEKNWNGGDSFRLFMRTVLPMIFMCAFGVWFTINISDSVKLLINPEFYAIKDILLMLTNPSAATLQ